MNECIFFIHIFLLFGAVALAKRFGKEALIVIVSLQVILSNLFVTKQIDLFGLNVTATDAYMIGSLVGMNLLQEYFGKDVAKKVLSINTFILIFFTAMALIQIFYKPSIHDSLHPSFLAILSFSPRIFISSIACFYLSQKLDVELFGKLRKKLSLPLAMALSLLISQALDTVLFSYLALYGLVHSLSSIIIMSYAIKLITLFSMTPLTAFFRKNAHNA
jgi:uncharacterized integral membrane protein (TIGR00697 family)